MPTTDRAWGAFYTYGRQHLQVTTRWISGVYLVFAERRLEASGRDRTSPLGEMRGEIVRLCGAAFIPAALATQVLREFIKAGMPARTEAMEADMAEARERCRAQQGRTRCSERGCARRHPPGGREEQDAPRAFRPGNARGK